MAKTLLYLHGFMSAPESFKAQVLKTVLASRKDGCHYVCPKLPIPPAEAVQVAMDSVKGVPAETLVVVGSSLGGFYANWIAEQTGAQAVLLNPVVDPWRIKILEDSPDRSDLQVKAWLDFREAYGRDLKALKVNAITRPERYFLLAATGDELLDWHLMVNHYQGARQIVIKGSNHGISEFEQYVPQVLAFCGLA